MKTDTPNMTLYLQIEALLAQYLKASGFPAGCEKVTTDEEMFSLSADGLYCTADNPNGKVYCLLLHIPSGLHESAENETPYRMAIGFVRSAEVNAIGLPLTIVQQRQHRQSHVETPPMFVYTTLTDTWLGHDLTNAALETVIDQEPTAHIEAFLARAQELLIIPAEEPDSPRGYCVGVRNPQVPTDHPDRYRVWTGVLATSKFARREIAVWTTIRTGDAFAIRKRSDAERCVEMFRRSADLFGIDLNIHEIEVVEHDHNWPDRTRHN